MEGLPLLSQGVSRKQDPDAPPVRVGKISGVNPQDVTVLQENGLLGGNLFPVVVGPIQAAKVLVEPLILETGDFPVLAAGQVGR